MKNEIRISVRFSSEKYNFSNIISKEYVYPFRFRKKGTRGALSNVLIFDHICSENSDIHTVMQSFVPFVEKVIQLIDDYDGTVKKDIIISYQFFEETFCFDLPLSFLQFASKHSISILFSGIAYE